MFSFGERGYGSTQKMKSPPEIRNAVMENMRHEPWPLMILTQMWH